MSDDGDAHGVGFNLARPVNGISPVWCHRFVNPDKTMLAIPPHRGVCELHSQFCNQQLFFPAVIAVVHDKCTFENRKSGQLIDQIRTRDK